MSLAATDDSSNTSGVGLEGVEITDQDLFTNFSQQDFGTINGFSSHVGFTNMMQQPSGPLPYVEIIEQPKQKGFRFRYMCEGKSHGGLPGEHSDSNRKTHPTIKVHNYKGPVRVVIKVVCEDVDQPHPHRLVGKNTRDGIFSQDYKGDSRMEFQFTGLGIQNVTKKRVPEILIKLLKEEAIKQKELLMLETFNFQSGQFSPVQLSDDELKDIETRAMNMSKELNLSVVRLMFEVSLLSSPRKEIMQILEPVFSVPIADSKSPTASNLRICRMSRTSGVATGGDEVYLLCDKVQKDDIAIVFRDKFDNPIWEDKGAFGINDVHHQFAIVFTTPPYRITNIQMPVTVKVCLERVSDNALSEPLDFTYYPVPEDPDNVTKKRRKVLPRSIQALPSDRTPVARRQVIGGQDAASLQLQSGPFVITTSRPIDQLVHSRNVPTTVQGGIINSQGLVVQGIPNVIFSQPNNLFRGPMGPLIINQNSLSPAGNELEADCAPPDRLVVADGGPRTAEDTSRAVAEVIKKPIRESCALPKPERDDVNVERDSGSGSASGGSASGAVGGRHDDAQGLVKCQVEDLEVLDSGVDPGVCISTADSGVGFESVPPQLEAAGNVASADANAKEDEETAPAQGDLDAQGQGGAQGELSGAQGEPAGAQGEPGEGNMLMTVEQLFSQVVERTVQALRQYSQTGDTAYLIQVQRHLVASQDNEGDNMIHIAVINRNYDVLRSLLMAASDITAPYESGISQYNEIQQTPLHIAVQTNQEVLVELLVRAGANVASLDRHGNTPLHIAAAAGFDRCLGALLETPCPNEHELRPDVILNHLNYEGYAPLHLAVRSHTVNMLRCVRVLTRADADVNLCDGCSGYTPLHHAVETENVGIVGYFVLDANADPNIPAFNGSSPLHLAVGRDCVSIAALLIASGADPLAENYEVVEEEEDEDGKGELEEGAAGSSPDETASGDEAAAAATGDEDQEKHGVTPMDLAAGNPKMERILEGESLRSVRESYSTAQSSDAGFRSSTVTSGVMLPPENSVGDLDQLDPVSRSRLAELLDRQHWRMLAQRLGLGGLVEELALTSSPTITLLAQLEALDVSTAQLRRELQQLQLGPAISVLDDARELSRQAEELHANLHKATTEEETGLEKDMRDMSLKSREPNQ